MVISLGLQQKDWRDNDLFIERIMGSCWEGYVEVRYTCYICVLQVIYLGYFKLGRIVNQQGQEVIVYKILVIVRS